MRWEVIRMYRDGQRLSGNEVRSAVASIGDVRLQVTLRGARIITEGVHDRMSKPHHA